MDLMNALAQAGGVEAAADGMRGHAAASPQGFGGLGAILASLAAARAVWAAGFSAESVAR
jgi:hypothetical protein